MSTKISIIDNSELSFTSKKCAANATKYQVGGDKNKKIQIGAEKLGNGNSSARLDNIIEKFWQTPIYRENNASAQVNNQLKEKEKNKIEKLSAKQKLYFAAKEVIEI